MDINKRIKELRKLLNMKQLDFANAITVSQGHLSDIENGRKEVTNKIQEIIILKFNVNEEWLHFGTEPVFLKPISDSLDDYARQKGVTEFEVNFIKGYLDIPKEIRASLEEHFKTNILPKIRNTVDDEIACTIHHSSLKTLKTAKTDDDIDEELAAYRQELEAEKKGTTSSASGE